MIDDAATVLEEIDPEDKIRSEVLSARIDIYLAAEKWDMVAAAPPLNSKFKNKIFYKIFASSPGSLVYGNTQKCHPITYR